MKIYFDKGEYYGNFLVEKESLFCNEINVSKSKGEWIQKTFIEFEKVQDYLVEILSKRKRFIK